MDWIRPFRTYSELSAHRKSPLRQVCVRAAKPWRNATEWSRAQALSSKPPAHRRESQCRPGRQPFALGEGHRGDPRSRRHLPADRGPAANTASRHLGSQFGSPAEKLVRAPDDAECNARSGKPFHVAGRKTTPSNGSPVVTKRQSAMISLRASASSSFSRLVISV